MNEAGLITIVVAVLGVVGGGGFWGYRQFSKETPVRQQDATIAAADKSVQMAIAVAAAANDNAAAADMRSKNFVDDLNTERSARKKLEDRVEGLEKTLHKVRSGFRIYVVAWDDLIKNWGQLRLLEDAPPHPDTDISTD